MNIDDIVELADIIKIHYQNFSIYKELYEEWLRVLKDYSKDKVFEKLDEYLENDSNRKRIPSPFDLKSGLITIDQEEIKTTDYLIRCNLCGKEMLLSQYENKHFDRCSSTRYLINILKNQGTEVSYEELANLDERTFQRVYSKYSGELKKEVEKRLKTWTQLI